MSEYKVRIEMDIEHHDGTHTVIREEYKRFAGDNPRFYAETSENVIDAAKRSILNMIRGQFGDVQNEKEIIPGFHSQYKPYKSS